MSGGHEVGTERVEPNQKYAYSNTITLTAPPVVQNPEFWRSVNSNWSPLPLHPASTLLSSDIVLMINVLGLNFVLRPTPFLLFGCIDSNTQKRKSGENREGLGAFITRVISSGHR